MLLTVKPFYNASEFSFSTVMAATSIAAFSYLGFDGISTLAEDSYNPRKDIARATVIVPDGFIRPAGRRRCQCCHGAGQCIAAAVRDGPGPAGGFLLSFQLAAEAINFGALLGFMGVNLSVISHYSLKQSRWRSTTFPWNFLLPAAGFPVCLYIFAHLSNTAKIIGGVWCVAGLVHAFVLTGGFQRELGALPDSNSID